MFCIFCQFNIKFDSLCVSQALFDFTTTCPSWYRWAFLHWSLVASCRFYLWYFKTIFIFVCVICCSGSLFLSFFLNLQQQKRLIICFGCLVCIDRDCRFFFILYSFGVAFSFHDSPCADGSFRYLARRAHPNKQAIRIHFEHVDCDSRSGRFKSTQSMIEFA